MARLDETDPEEARRRDRALLERPAGGITAQQGGGMPSVPGRWYRCAVCRVGYMTKVEADACHGEAA